MSFSCSRSERLTCPQMTTPPHRGPVISGLSPCRPEWALCAALQTYRSSTHLSSHVLGALGAETLQRPRAAHMVIETLHSHKHKNTWHRRHRYVYTKTYTIEFHRNGVCVHPHTSIVKALSLLETHLSPRRCQGYMQSVGRLHNSKGSSSIFVR